MNDPQIWTLIAAFVGLQGVTLALMQRQLGAVESRLDGRLDSLRDETRARFGDVDRRFDQQADLMNARFDHQAEIMNLRFAALEGDMKLVKAHLIPPAA